MAQVLGGFGGCHLAEFRSPVIDLAVVTDDSVDTAVNTGGDIELVFERVITEVISDPEQVIIEAAIHIHDVDGTVWCVIDIYRSEAFVGGGEKLPSLIGKASFLINITRIARDDQTLDQVAGGFRRESIALILLAELVATIDHSGGNTGRLPQRTVFSSNDSYAVATVDARGVSRPKGLVGS